MQQYAVFVTSDALEFFLKYILISEIILAGVSIPFQGLVP